MHGTLSAENFSILESGPGGAAWNMALDEALLCRARQLRMPVLRFYGWTGPAASFGYFQKIAEIERATLLRPLVRRPTGGGLVPHDADWTYSVAIPAGHPWHRIRAEQSYERIHRWLQAAFGALGIRAELASSKRQELPGQCFAGWEKNDLLLGGRKIAGAAQRRTQTGLLIQGSVQPPAGVERKAWEQAMLETGWQGVRIEWTRLKLPDELLEFARKLASEKYSRLEYNRMR